VAGGFPAIPRIPVTIIAMSTSFLIWPQVGGSLSCICLTSSHFLGCLLVSGGVSLSGSLSWDKSSVSASSSLGPGDPWGLTNHDGAHTGCSAPSGKTQTCPGPHMAKQWAMTCLVVSPVCAEA
jgi:hypothetical protein